MTLCPVSWASDTQPCSQAAGHPGWEHNMQTTLVREYAISYTITHSISYMFRDRHTASRPRPAARGVLSAIIIREDSASIFTFSSLRDSQRESGPKWRQRRPLASSRWWVPTATQTKGSDWSSHDWVNYALTDRVRIHVSVFVTSQGKKIQPFH